MAMLLGLVPYGWLYLVQRVYYAYEDARTPFWLQLLVAGVATGFNVAILVLQPDQAGVIVGLGQTVSNLLGALLGFVLLRRKLGPLRTSGAVQVYVRLAIASAVAAGVGWLVLQLGDGIADSGFVGRLVVVGVTGLVFAALALGLAHLLRVREASQLLDPLVRRLRRRPS